MLAAPAQAEPDIDTTDYFDSLSHFGITVTGNEAALLRLANMTCAMRQQGLKTAEIGEYIEATEQIPARDANNIASNAYINFCP